MPVGGATLEWLRVRWGRLVVEAAVEVDGVPVRW